VAPSQKPTYYARLWRRLAKAHAVVERAGEEVSYETYRRASRAFGTLLLSWGFRKKGGMFKAVYLHPDVPFVIKLTRMAPEEGGHYFPNFLPQRLQRHFLPHFYVSRGGCLALQYRARPAPEGSLRTISKEINQWGAGRGRHYILPGRHKLAWQLDVEVSNAGTYRGRVIVFDSLNPLYKV
jgi:hypothetical protein